MSAPRDPFELDAEQMRRLGYEAVDRIIEHFTGVRDERVTNKIAPVDARARFSEPIPDEPADPHDVLRSAIDDVLSHAMRLDHPRFFAYIPSPNNFVSVIADALVAGFNPFGGTWQAASGPTAVELVVLDWLRDLIEMPETAGGLFVSGGSMANLIALATARYAHGVDASGIVYASDQTHSSIERALKTLGFAPDRLRTLATGPDWRLDPATLAAAIDEDRRAGGRPFAVVANAGTTNTGTVDPLGELATLCKHEQVWLHADGAYGVGAIASDEGRRALDGLSRVDSLSFDPHKWWFQPIEAACVLVRDASLLRDTFSILPAYLRDTRGADAEVNLCDYGVQLTRAARALKLWMSIKTFGMDEFRRAIDHGLELARYAERALEASEDWTVVSPASLAIVAFRSTLATDDAAALHADIVREMYREGFAMLSGTTLGDTPVLRLCTINPRTTEEDIDRTIERLSAAARRLTAP